jgi:uncharacterized protein involved in exopolysaccharide biosynthesis
MTDNKANRSSNTAAYDDGGQEITLTDLFSAIWAGKSIVFAFTSLGAVVALSFALSMPNIYAANALLAPAENSGSGMSGLMRQYGGLANLAGVPLPGNEEGSRAQLGMQLMRSRGFIAEFVERRDIMPELMAVDSWDSVSREIVFDREIYDTKTKTWVRQAETDKTGKPSRQEAHKAFLKILGVSQDKKTGYVQVSIEHQSPVMAAQWVSWLVEDVNSAVKSQDVEEAKKSIAYLKQQISNTSLAELQAVFFELIQSQTERVMLAEVRPEYVFKTIDPAVVPEVKSKPSRALILVLGVILGGTIGVVASFIRYFSRSPR